MDLSPSGGEPAGEMLVCPTCDEPFVPRHPRRCEWCGHEFADGTDEQYPSSVPDPINVRMIAVAIVLAILLAGMAAYLTWLLSAPEVPAFDITTRKSADQIKVAVENDTATFDVTSPSGIGGATIALTKGNWPKSVVVRLHLHGLESFAVLQRKDQARRLGAEP